MLIVAACSDAGCGSGAAPSRYLICCVFIVTLILDLVLWEALLLRSHNNNSGFRLAFFSTVQALSLFMKHASVQINGIRWKDKMLHVHELIKPLHEVI